MAISDQKKLQKRIDEFLERFGHGAMTALAEQSDYSRQYIGQVRKGRAVGRQFIKTVNDALDNLESVNSGYDADAPRDTVGEIRTILGGLLKTLEKREACSQAQLNLISAGCKLIISDLIPILEDEIAGVETEVVADETAGVETEVVADDSGTLAG